MSKKQKSEKILVFDFGGQYTQLIAQRVREANVFSELVPYDLSIKRIKEENPRGIILSGGPASVYEENAPFVNKTMFNLDIPMLGICYGMQLMAHMLPGGKVKKS